MPKGRCNVLENMFPILAFSVKGKRKGWKPVTTYRMYAYLLLRVVILGRTRHSSVHETETLWNKNVTCYQLLSLSAQGNRNIEMMRKNVLLIPMLIYFLMLFIPISGKDYNIQTDTHRNPKFIAFNTNSGKIEISLDLSLPFLTIPLEEKTENSGLIQPSLKINPKALTILSIFTVLSTLIFPWFRKEKQKSFQLPIDLHHYNKEHKAVNRGLDLFYLENTINESLFQNIHIKPCMQNIICWAVASAFHSQNPSSMHKLIDKISSHTLFNKVTNNTFIKDAVLKGRKVLEPNECIAVYKQCTLVNQEIIVNIFKIFGIY